MEAIGSLLDGFAVALQPENLLFALIGCLVGTLIGVLPGIGPVTAVALLIPVTTGMSPLQAIIMLAAIYYGTQYGGTISSVLINVPGESASAVTCLDGYPMAQKGRAGAALTIAAVGSFVGGTVATGALVFIALPLARLALQIGPAEFFALTIVGLSLVAGLAGKSLVRGLIAAVIGLLVAMVGMDPALGVPRYTFGQTELLDGVGIVPVSVGLFGLSEIFLNLERRVSNVYASRIGPLLVSRSEARASVGPIARGTGIGFVLGLIPGVGSVVPTFLSYSLERRISKSPDRFGYGAIEGVAGPETANNAYANAALIPMFTLGIPSSPTIAVLMGAFIANGLTPGPFLFQEHPDIAWGIIASLYVGNVMLLVLNIPLIPMWVMFLKTPYPLMVAGILVLSVVGTYAISSSTFDVAIMLGFGVLGYIFKKVDIPLAPLMLTLVIGPIMEQNLRSTMQLAGGDWTFFLTRPIALLMLAAAGGTLILASWKGVARMRGGDAEV